MTDRLEKLCAEVHERYEKSAKRVGWKSQVGEVPWDAVPEVNKRVMRSALQPISYQLAKQQARIDELELRGMSVVKSANEFYKALRDMDFIELPVTSLWGRVRELGRAIEADSVPGREPNDHTPQNQANDSRSGTQGDTP